MEAEVSATLYGCQDAVPLRNTLANLGHVQGETMIITDNECCEGILNNTVNKILLKAMDIYLSTDDGALLPPDHESKLPARPNDAVHFMSTVMRQVLSSATEAEVGVTFYGCQDAVPLCNTLADLGHFQGATLIVTDNECCEVILNNTVKKRRSKAMDMRFYWVKCRIAQGQLKLLWPSGRENIADYFTKMHAQVHHKNTRPLYVITSLTSRGCNKGVFISTNIP